MWPELKWPSLQERVWFIYDFFRKDKKFNVWKTVRLLREQFASQNFAAHVLTIDAISYRN